MARVMKSFNTEAEFEEWANSPDMRTPYTCLVKNTGAVHYFEGDDNDDSITAVIKKTSWVKLGTPALTREIKNVYLNGERIDIESLPHGDRSSYYYRHDEGYEEKEDFEYRAGLYGDDEIATRGGVYTTYDGALNYYPRRMAKGHTNHSMHEYERFLYVKKWDTLKIVFKSKYFYSFAGIRLVLFGYNGIDDDKVPKLYSLHRISKEIIIGDGFEEINGGLLHLYKCPKVFFGKNVKRICDQREFVIGTYDKRKSFMRKNTQIHYRNQRFPINSKIIRL